MLIHFTCELSDHLCQAAQYEWQRLSQIRGLYWQIIPCSRPLGNTHNCESVCVHVSEGAIMSARVSDDVSAEGHGSPFGPAEENGAWRETEPCPGAVIYAKWTHRWCNSLSGGHVRGPQLWGNGGCDQLLCVQTEGLMCCIWSLTQESLVCVTCQLLNRYQYII